jgi:hypothetical protein
MTLIEDLDLATYCGRIGNLYTRYGLSPPFALYDAARGWMARDIPLWHCVDVIKRYLTNYGRSCPSGSGDRNFIWLSGLIERSWYARSFVAPPRSAPKHVRHHDGLDEYGAEEPNQRAGHRRVIAAVPKLDSKNDSFEPDRIAVRQNAAGAILPVGGTRSVSPQKIQPKRSASKSSCSMPAPGQTKVDIAAAWLRSVLTGVERPAADVEAEARCVGISPRTYDRARQRLGVTSRRIGFGRWAKYMIALPAVDGTLGEEANRAGVT